MPSIELLSQETIDKIAAGEVVERPASVVKELVENAIDAHATIITIEIVKGGMTKIRVSDNGYGIPNNQVQMAFVRHSTSKIKTAEDLNAISSLGFRGEALSSIAAVSQVELITKTKDEMLGTRYVIEGAAEKKIEEIGAPDGTTFIVRNIFYNTLPRQKFLKSAMTEGNYIHDIVEKLALSHPDIAFQLSIDGKTKVSSVGSGRLKDTVYQIYGKSITDNILEINSRIDNYKIYGYIGESVISRGNRNFENAFINGRFVKSKLLYSAIEEGYKGYLMQHQYPFCSLFIEVDTDVIDVNVHPTKLEVRIDEPDKLTSLITDSIYNTLHNVEDIREESLTEEQIDEEKYVSEERTIDKTIENKSVSQENTIIEPYETKKFEEIKEEKIEEIKIDNKSFHEKTATKLEQLSFLSEEAVKEHKIIGQLFDTYWLVEFDDSLYIVDQHAAHEKVLYEKTLASLKNKEMTSQAISPPVIVTLSAREESFLNDNICVFEELGYRLEHFGGKDYAIKGIPDNIYGIDAKSLFLDLIADCTDTKFKSNTIILDKIASMSCKAAVKGNDSLSIEESKELINELLSLDNPFHCPHGRPTIIKMTKQEIEKKFKRII